MTAAYRFTRREVLRLCVGLPALAALAGASVPAVSGTPAGQTSMAKVKAARARLSAGQLSGEYATGTVSAAGGVGAASGGTGLLLSQRFEAPLPFQALGFCYLPHGQGDLSIWLRTSAEGETWTDWHLCGVENLAPAADGLTYSTLFFTPGDELHSYAQVRAVLKPRATGDVFSISDFGLVYIDASAGPSASAESASVMAADVPVSALAGDKPSVVSRTAWGCPDGQVSLGHYPDNPTVLPWYPDYFPATHIIVHHTATANTSDHWYAVLRSIWYYHAVTLGWADIGYNFLIDPSGTIYEGRAYANATGHSDDDVEAGHCYSYNRYTVGLAIIGDYRTTAPTTVSVTAAERLMAWKFSQRGLGPADNGPIQRACDQAMVTMPRIAGHTDYGSAGWGANVCPGYPSPQTECPGAMLENQLPAIRSATANMTASYSAALTGISIGPSMVAVGSRLTVSVTIQNTGGTTLSSGSPATSYVFNEGDRVAGDTYGTFRLGLDFDGHDSSYTYPYRWGIGGDLPPGASRTIQVAINILGESIKNYWVGLIREGVGTVVDRQGVTSIQARVKHGDICLANVSIRPSTVFVGNVLGIYAEVENWTNQTLQTQGPNPGYVYAEGEVCSADVANAYRMGLEYSTRSGGKDHPYRWGLGSSVPPLTVRSVRGFVRFPTARSARDFWVGFVQENVAWVQDNLARTSVTVKQPAARVRLPFTAR